MLHQHQFRAWHAEGGDDQTGAMIPNQDQGYEGNVFAWFHEGQPIEIMAGLCLTDRDDVAVYEDDLIMIVDNGAHYRVEYSIKACSWLLTNHKESWPVNHLILKQGKVVGNRFETPELYEATYG